VETKSKSRWGRWGRFLAATSLVLLACTSGGSSSGPPTGAVVGPDGGTFRFFGGAVTLDFPPGALAAETSITVEAVDAASLGPRFVPGASFELGPDGLTFAHPVLLTVAYDPARVPQGTDPQLLRLYQPASGAPQLVSESRLDLSSATVAGPLLHFSPYGTAEATPEDLFADIEAMWAEAVLATGGRLETLDKAILADISVVYPIDDGLCAQTDLMSQKTPLVAQLSTLGKIVQQLDLAYPIEIDSECDHLLDEKQTGIGITSIPSLLPVLQVYQSCQLTARIYGPSNRTYYGTIGWWTDGPSVAALFDITGNGATLEGLGPGATSIHAFSNDLPNDIKTTIDVQVVEGPDAGSDSGGEGGPPDASLDGGLDDGDASCTTSSHPTFDCSTYEGACTCPGEPWEYANGWCECDCTCQASGTWYCSCVSL
jgi:hypothetical protein